MNVRMRVKFSGRVQGVFFRAHAKRFAEERDVRGWVRNTENGNVEALFEGEEEAVKAVIQKCQFSQPYARVESVDIEREDPRGDLTEFRIMH